MNIGKVYISKTYKLLTNSFVLGIGISFSEHVHPDSDSLEKGILETNELCITMEFLLWGFDIQIDRIQ